MPPRRRASPVLFALCAALLPLPAQAVTDYDPQNRGWNGCSELVRAAAEADIDLRPVRVLDWDQVQRGQALLVLYPTESLGVADVSAFVEEGGRVAWFDDFGASRALLDWLQFRRAPAVQGTAHDPSMRELLVAPARAQHPLTEGVDALITNIPVAYTHPRLSPLFDFGDATQGLVLVGQVGRGKLIVGGDPSVFINTMQQFPGNRRFARNLLEFLAAGSSPRVTLVFGDTRVRGAWRGRGRAQTRQREAVNTLNESLRALGEALSVPAALRPLSALLGAAVCAALALLRAVLDEVATASTLVRRATRRSPSSSSRPSSRAATACSRASPASPRPPSSRPSRAAIGGAFKRIQFTPDLLPSDITGTYVLSPATAPSSCARGPSSPTWCSATRSTAPRPRPRARCSRRCRSARSPSTARPTARRALLRARHAEPHRAGGHLPPARGAGRPLPHARRGALSLAPTTRSASCAPTPRSRPSPAR
jgi:hypothetical protein